MFTFFEDDDKEEDLSDEEWKAFNREIFDSKCRLLNVVIKIFGLAFKDITDVNLNNLRDFLIPILEAYRDGRIKCVYTILDIGEAIEKYIYTRYSGEFNIEYIDAHTIEDEPCKIKWLHPLNERDPRSVALGVVFEMSFSVSDIVLPEDTTFYIEQLKTPPHAAPLVNKRIDRYVNQLDHKVRADSAKERGLYDAFDQDLYAAVKKMREEFDKAALKTP